MRMWPPLLIVLERVDPARNIARYYVLSIEPTLFAKHTLIRRWGPIGCLGRERLQFFGGRISQIRRLRGMAVLPECAEKKRIRDTRSRRPRYDAGFSNKMSGRRPLYQITCTFSNDPPIPTGLK
jgi:predicted DNA-binding WGR domain protein